MMSLLNRIRKLEEKIKPHEEEVPPFTMWWQHPDGSYTDFFTGERVDMEQERKESLKKTQPRVTGIIIVRPEESHVNS